MRPEVSSRVTSVKLPLRLATSTTKRMMNGRADGRPARPGLVATALVRTAEAIPMP